MSEADQPEVTWEVWRTRGNGGPDYPIRTLLGERQARGLLLDCRLDGPIDGIDFYLVRATTTREKVK